jgi:hypothetical protein
MAGPAASSLATRNGVKRLSGPIIGDDPGMEKFLQEIIISKHIAKGRGASV